MLTDDEIDEHLGAVLRASGSALKHYSMHSTTEAMRAAMRAIERAAAERMRERCKAVCQALADDLPTFDGELGNDDTFRAEALYTAYEAITALPVTTKGGD